jgi:hypothetical protein
MNAQLGGVIRSRRVRRPGRAGGMARRGGGKGLRLTASWRKRTRPLLVCSALALGAVYQLEAATTLTPGAPLPSRLANKGSSKIGAYFETTGQWRMLASTPCIL